MFEWWSNIDVMHKNTTVDLKDINANISLKEILDDPTQPLLGAIEEHTANGSPEHILAVRVWVRTSDDEIGTQMGITSIEARILVNRMRWLGLVDVEHRANQISGMPEMWIRLHPRSLWFIAAIMEAKGRVIAEEIKFSPMVDGIRDELSVFPSL
jgi:hypothetical protein